MMVFAISVVFLHSAYRKELEVVLVIVVTEVIAVVAPDAVVDVANIKIKEKGN